MSNLGGYIHDFFSALEVFEDIEHGHSYKVFMEQSILVFLDNETKETAFEVYRSFFDSYRIVIEGSSNPFVDLLDILKQYEMNAAVLIDKQRDHYIHSVNVFILGLCIYAHNSPYRKAFDKTNMDRSVYPERYETKHEEFFYRWGIAALFHDVGYPIEIAAKQATKFISFVADVDGAEEKVRTHIEFDNFEELNSIVEVIPKQKFIKTYYDRYESCVYIDLLKPLDLLAQKIHLAFGIEIAQIKHSLEGFTKDMSRSGFVDHGFYSSIIVLKWYAYLVQKANYTPEYFYYPVLDSASAILLHNYYKNVLMRPPFSLKAMHPEKHPIAFLLILCDELQEWNREAYGIVDKKSSHAKEVELLINDSQFIITYVTHEGCLHESFSAKKSELLFELLDLKVLFGKSFSVNCRSLDKYAAFRNLAIDSAAEPRPLLKYMEILAKEIHTLYNKKQLALQPDAPLKYPTYEKLPDSLKYSNLRQAMDIPEKARLMGCVIRPLNTVDDLAITDFNDGLVEYLAEIEHENWINERLDSGWVTTDSDNNKAYVSPYFTPYCQLDEETKELDRDTIRNIPYLLATIEMGLFKADLVKKSRKAQDTQ